MSGLKREQFWCCTALRHQYSKRRLQDQRSKHAERIWLGSINGDYWKERAGVDELHAGASMPPRGAARGLSIPR